MWICVKMELRFRSHCMSSRTVFRRNQTKKEKKTKKRQKETSCSWYRKWAWCQWRAWERSPAFSQETSQPKSEVTRGATQPPCPDMLKYVCVHVRVCVSKWLSEFGDRRSWAIPLCVFTPSLNSRPATEANGVLIYSWMTHTCCPLCFPNSQ